jgi:hypothetical protein
LSDTDSDTGTPAADTATNSDTGSSTTMPVDTSTSSDSVTSHDTTISTGTEANDTETDTDNDTDTNMDFEFCSSDTYLKFKATKPYILYNSMSPAIGNNTDPEVVIAGYSYFGCPHCQHWGEDVNEIFKDPVIRKRAVYYFKHFPFYYEGTNWNGHRAAFAAHVQNKFWPMHDKIFEHIGNYTEDDIKNWAKELGLEMTKFEADYKSETNAQIIKEEKEYAQDNYNVHGTPKVFINGIKLISRSYTAQIVRCLLYEIDHPLKK